MKEKFMKGDYIYYHDAVSGTTPAIVFRVGRTNPNWWTKFQGQLLIDGDWEGIKLRKWVQASKCELQVASCPCCDSPDIKLISAPVFKPNKWVKCNECGICTSYEMTINQALQKWNKRPTK